VEDWKQYLIEDATRDYLGYREHLHRTAEKSRRVLELKMKLIQELRKPVNLMFGDTMIFIQTDDFSVAHDVARALGITLYKDVDSDGVKYVGYADGIEVQVYGVKRIPKCRLVPKTVTETVTKTVYEVVCD